MIELAFKLLLRVFRLLADGTHCYLGVSFGKEILAALAEIRVSWQLFEPIAIHMETCITFVTIHNTIRLGIIRMETHFALCLNTCQRDTAGFQRFGTCFCLLQPLQYGVGLIFKPSDEVA